MKKSPTEIMSEQSRILATFIDAYLTRQEDFEIFHKMGGGLMINHRGIPHGFDPSLTYIHALVRDGRLDLEYRDNVMVVSIPNSVLREISAREGRSLDVAAGEPRVQALMAGPTFITYFQAPVAGFAQGTGTIHQTNVQNNITANVNEVVDKLLALGVTPEQADELRREVDSVEDGPSKAERARAWFLGFATQMGSGAAANHIPEIAQAIQHFAQSVM